MASGGRESAGHVFLALSLSAVAKYVFSLFHDWRSRVFNWSSAQSAGPVGRVVGLSLYPIKSCAGIPLQQANATPLGLEVESICDRHWLVVRENGDFVTQRQHPRLALVQCSAEGSGADLTLTCSAPSMPTLKVPVHPSDSHPVRSCRVWDSRLEGRDCGDEAGRWFSQLLGLQGLRLLYSAPGLDKRDCTDTVKPWGTPARAGDQSAYADFAPYLVVNEASVRQINSELEGTKVSQRNFRGNIIVDCEPPFIEDKWAALKIGDVVLRMMDPCTRCVMTTVDPATGIKDPTSEPLNTLKRVRCFPEYGKSPLFGVNAAVDVPGSIQIGDSVFAIPKS